MLSRYQRRHDEGDARCSEVLCYMNGGCHKDVRMERACQGVGAKCVKNDGKSVKSRGEDGNRCVSGTQKAVVRATYRGYRKTLAIVNSPSLDGVRYCRMLLGNGRK